MIEVKNVSKRYGGVIALNGVSFRVEKGHVTGLLGQNGAGKTTLLNILTGYLAATEGRALIGGHDPLLNPREAKQLIGYLPEHPPLYDEMTVREYLCFVCELKGVIPRAIPAHVDEIMEKTGLTDMRFRLLANVSKGYRQRAGMAQALCGSPDALILDEPTIGLDPKQITEMRSLIGKLAKKHTILFSTHMLSEAQQLCDHVVILHRGGVKMDLPIEQAHNSEEVTLFCTIAAEPARVLPALRQLAGVKRVREQPDPRPEVTTALLSFHRQAEPERLLFTLLSGLSLPLLHLSRREDSLEQVFLRAISE